jgi:hypothetical protein
MEALVFNAQANLTGQAADLQHEQIRQQQVQLRLQQNQSELMRLQKMRQVLASEQVQFGVRNIAAGSGTIRAITEQNFVNFMQDETADKLNYMAKQQNLNIANAEVDLRKRSQYISEASGFLSKMASYASAGMGGGMGGGGLGVSASGGAMGGDNLFDNMNLNG